MSSKGSGLDAQTASSSSPLPADKPSFPSRIANATTHDAVSDSHKPVPTLAIYCARLPEPTVNSFCGAMGGMASGIVTCPLDVIKTRLQAQGSFRRNPTPPSSMLYHGMVGTAKTIWKEDGIRGMYRGLGPMLLGYLPTWAVYMTVYDASRDYYRAHTGENMWLCRIYASITAGACSTLATNPIWVLKTRIMAQAGVNAPPEAQTPWRYKSTVDAARSMFREEGIRVFYSGLAPALLGLSHVAIQFPLYEYFKERFTGLAMGENTPESDSSHHWIGILAATFLSKMCATSATYPHEVLRTRLQTQQRTSPAHTHDDVSFRGKLGDPHLNRAPGGASSDGMINLPRYKGMLQTIATIVREEGWRAFYNGLGTNMIRAIPAAMTTMVTYETLKTSIHKLQMEGRSAMGDDYP